LIPFAHLALLSAEDPNPWRGELEAQRAEARSNTLGKALGEPSNGLKHDG